MKNFVCLQDNPYHEEVVNVYRDGQHWGTGEQVGEKSFAIPTLNKEGNQFPRLYPSLRIATGVLNQYHGFCRSSARDRAYLGVA